MLVYLDRNDKIEDIEEMFKAIMEKSFLFENIINNVLELNPFK